MRNAVRWVPAGLLALGLGLVGTVGKQRPMPLTTPLDRVPMELEGFASRELPISKETQKVAGMSSYLSRIYGTDAFTVYVGYYESQAQGRTIHSPKNCLPGAGWEAISQSERQVETSAGTVALNRYMIVRKAQRAVVYYWYQGRGRVTANEYRVKWELIRDASLRSRTDEALVRIVVPISGSEAEAEALAQRVAKRLVPVLQQILPS